MSHDDDRPKPPQPAALDETAVPDTIPDTQPALEVTLAAGTSGGKSAPAATGSVIRPPKPLTRTVDGDSDGGIVVPPEQIDRYVLKQRLGAGGMGVVYRATDSELGRDIAIKVIKSGASADRLKREAQSLARLDHRNVVTVYDVGVHDGRVWVAMELVDGTNLHDWLRSGDHTYDEVMRVLLLAADGIIAAHAAGLIHRDLKPDNIFVANDGNVLVGDFGIARDADDDDGKGFISVGPEMSLTQTGNVLGTPAYMAPEQAEGEATERSDQFSFCVTAYEALHGTRPFPGSTFQEILDRVDSGEVEAPKHRRRVPGAIARAIRRGLSADPANRHASMRDLVTELQPTPRRVWPWVAVGAVLVAGAAAGIALATHEDAPTQASAIAGCSSAGHVETVWNPVSRTALILHLRLRSFTPNAVDEIAARLDDYAKRWSAQRKDTCVAKAMGQLDARASTARSMCETLALGAFAGALHTLETNDSINAMSAAQHASSLPLVEGCASDDALKLSVATTEHENLMLALTDWEVSDLAMFPPLRARAEAANDLPAQLEISLAEAKQAIDESSFAVADAALQRATPLAEQLDASGARAHVLALTARLRCEQGRAPESYLPMAEAAGKRLDPVRNALETYAVLEARAACLARDSDPSLAIPLFEQLIVLKRDRHTTPLDEVMPRSALALLYYRLGRPDEAAKQEAKVVEIFSHYTSDTSALGKALDSAATGAFMAGDVHGAIAHQLRATPLFTRPILKAQSMSALAMDYDVLLDWKSAIAMQVQLIKLMTSLPASALGEQLLADAYVYGGSDRLYVDDVDGAVDWLDNGLQLATKLADTELIAVAQLGLGRAWLRRKEYARAMRFTQDGLAAHAQLGDKAMFRVALGLYTLAQAQWALDDSDSARASAAQAELTATRGLDQTRGQPLAAYGQAFRQRQLDEIVRWRDEHK